MANELTYPQGFINAINNIQVSDNAYAIIHVIYPEGSTCNCTKGNITFTADDTSGEYWFRIPKGGEWIISCNNESESSASKAIIINQYAQIEEVRLKYFPIPGDILNNYSWEDISMISQAGVGDEYFDVGDRKAVTLNGNIGNYLTLSNTTLYVFILDFNHPVNKTIEDNNIIFGGFKTALTDGVDICLCDRLYNSSSSSISYFKMNPTDSSYGAWKGCDFRYDILGTVQTAPSPYRTEKTASTSGSDATIAAITSPKADTLMSALPSDFKNVLRLWTRYVQEPTVDGSNKITACIDAGISLLAEFEIFGSRSNAYFYEQDHQKQMQYYTAGNSKVKYKHNETSTTAYWWEISANSRSEFCAVSTSGNSSYRSSIGSNGLAPAFKV